MGEEFNDPERLVEKKSFWLTVFTVLLLAIFFGGVFLITRQKSSPENPQKNEVSEAGKSTLLELTTAPENKPEFKPNPELTALTTAPRDPNRTEISKINVDDLTAPSIKN